MTSDTIISQHLELCEETYNILSEENRLLRNAEGSINQDFLDRKTELLQRLEFSLEALQRLNTHPQAKTEQTNGLIDKAQKRLMQIFLLDRENERLLTAYQDKRQQEVSKASLRQEGFDKLQEAYENQEPESFEFKA